MGDCLQFFINAFTGGTTPTIEAEQNHDRPKNKPSRQRCASVFLRGCETDDEHKIRKKLLIELLRPMHGKEGLEACGLEYRQVTIGEDGKLVQDSVVVETTTHSTTESYHIEEKKEEHLLVRPPATMTTSRRNQKPPPVIRHMHMTRLFHKESNTMITNANRKEFIADGAMYDIVCRLAMEYSQEIMIQDGHLEWVTIENPTEGQPIPIRALVSQGLLEIKSRLDKEPTLVIITGKGHVRAGIFSRQHLLVSGLECSSSVQFVHEARRRNMNLIILDPNAHGDRCAMKTFEKSMSYLFQSWEAAENETTQVQPNLYVLSHSQSGAQFVRYLLTKADSYLSKIAAIAFTDSTHNIQWAKRQNQTGLEELLECDRTVYFKRTDDIIQYVLKPFKSVGKPVDTDMFWEHRFGKIQTRCAGTSEHSLVNWFAREHIWEHFDRFLLAAS